MKWHIPYDGRDWLFDDSRITASEARIQKRVTGGMTPAAADRARNELDGDAFLAALLIAMRRAGEDDVRVERIDLDELVLSDILDRTLSAARAELAERTAEQATEAPAEDAPAAEDVAAVLPVAEPAPTPERTPA